MVYVLNKEGKPLMPTNRYDKVRILLKQKKVEIVKRTPFTIKLLYDVTNYTQPIELDIDAGSKHIGISASTKDKEVFSGEVEIRDDISKLLDTRREQRRTRRNRKTRYRKPRFNNRAASKQKGWIAPSVRCKVESHINIIKMLHSILPITSIKVEVGQFDIQKLKNPDTNSIEYQQGELYGYANLREYIFARDNHTCQYCKGKSGSKILHIHHFNYWRGDHTDKPSSVITLCDICNDSKNHKKDGFLYGWEPKITKTFKDATVMNTMRFRIYNELKEIYDNVSLTYGYKTKAIRIENNLPKEHRIDALCISGNPNKKLCDTYYYLKKTRNHNRQIHKMTISKGGNRKLNQSPFVVKGFHLFDKVLFNGKECFITGRRIKGYFKLTTLDGTVIHNSAKVKNLKLLEPRKSYIIETRQNIIRKENMATP